jgi:7-keto-8-aminopelargonate synthetase-like enzyme
VDDAHATSWLGAHGRGFALDFFTNRARVVVALSLNKAFSAAGGAIVFPTAELRDRVRRCGGPMLFSGPVQPPMLGAAIASAHLHLEPSFALLQGALLERIRLVIARARSLGIPLANEELTPIFFMPCGPMEKTFKLIHALRDAGYYVSPGMFPAVPREKSGPRFTVSLHNTPQDVEEFMEALARLAQAQNTTSRSSMIPVAGPDHVQQQGVAGKRTA